MGAAVGPLWLVRISAPDLAFPTRIFTLPLLPHSYFTQTSQALKPADYEKATPCFAIPVKYAWAIVCVCASLSLVCNCVVVFSDSVKARPCVSRVSNQEPS